MRDVSPKSSTLRTAKATARLAVSARTIEAIQTGSLPKADPTGTARIAGIQAAKNTSALIPYCHQIPLDHVAVDIAVEGKALFITAEVKAIWKTGVEMEALTAATVTALTLYDMLKPIDDDMELESVKLVGKTGGKSSSGESGRGLTAAVLVIGDSVSAGTRADQSGVKLQAGLANTGINVVEKIILPDEQVMIEKELTRLADSARIDLIATTGGTGAGPRDVTPEATVAVIDRRLNGIEEVLRNYGQLRTTTAMLSRAVAGLRGATLILNFPGSPKGVDDGLHAVFPAVLHLFRMLKGEGH